MATGQEAIVRMGAVVADVEVGRVEAAAEAQEEIAAQEAVEIAAIARTTTNY